MKIPEKIKIGGKTYTVEITSKMDLGINNVSAEILYNDLIIRVSPQATAKMEADLIHEMVHAIYFGLGYRDHDEKRVDELAHICSPINTKYLHRVGAVCPYLVKVTVDALNIRSAPGADSPITGCIRGGGVFTIVTESAGWGKLKSGAGWISLDYTAKV